MWWASMSSYTLISRCHSASETTDEAARQDHSLLTIEASMMMVHVTFLQVQFRGRGRDQSSIEGQWPH